MTSEEKQLLLKDLCERLPYGIKFSFGCFNNNYEAKGVDLIVTDDGEWEYVVTAKGIIPVEIKYIRYYLRPLSSMTDEEIKELNDIEPSAIVYGFSSEIIRIVDDTNGLGIKLAQTVRVIDWLNAHYFDYRGLIDMGLALEAPEDMYKL